MLLSSVAESFNREIPHPELAHLNYRRFQPHPLLAPWVQCYWSACLFSPPATDIVEKMYPDGGVSITFNLQNPSRHWLSAKQSLHTMVVTDAMDSFGVRFHPAGAQWLLQTPLSDINQQHYLLSDFSLIGVDELAEDLTNASSLRHRVLLVDQWLIECWQKLQPTINLAQSIVRQWPIGEVYNDGDFASWCRLQRINRRTAERAFNYYLGISPGQFKILQQVRIARESIKHNPFLPLSEIALTAGYYDQAHFTRQFRKVTGQTPGVYQQRQQNKFPTQ